jgi:hypothetical protein
MGRAWVVWTYIWRVLVGLVTVWVVLYVFGKLHERLETIVVALAGILYVTLIGAWAYLVWMQSQSSLSLLRAVSIAGADTADERLEISRNFDEQESALVHVAPKLLINTAFNGLVLLICLWRLFSVL